MKSPLPDPLPAGWFAKAVWFPFQSRLCDPDDPLCAMREKARRMAKLAILNREHQARTGTGWGDGHIHGIGVATAGRRPELMTGKARTRLSV